MIPVASREGFTEEMAFEPGLEGRVKVHQQEGTFSWRWARALVMLGHQARRLATSGRAR